MTIRRIFYVVLFFLTVINYGCKTENHIDKYEVSLDSLKMLPDGFYAYRRGRVYFEDFDLEKYRIWYNLDNYGNIENIFKLEDFNVNDAEDDEIISKYKIDTLKAKIVMQTFINFSRKFKFGHIDIDKGNKISFSNKDGLSEQYVKAFNDSTKNIYMRKIDFKILENGWFEYVEK